MWTTLFGHRLTPYTLEPVQWLLVIWLLVRLVRLRDDRLLLAGEAEALYGGRPGIAVQMVVFAGVALVLYGLWRPP